MDGMHGTQSDHAHLDLLLLDIWLCAFWHITQKLCRAQCWIKSILTFTLSRPHSLTFIYYYNRQQNELRHFALNWAFYILLTSTRGSIAFPPSSPPCNVVPMFKLPTENSKHPNFERRGQRRGANSFVLWTYPIWVQCLNYFVAHCSYRVTRMMKL